MKFITDWMVQFQIEALAKEIDYESALIKVTKLIDNNRLYVFEDPYETIVSMASATESWFMGLQLVMYILRRNIGAWVMPQLIYII